MTNFSIDKLVKPINRFIHNAYSSSIILFMATLIAMIWANSPFKESYFHLWEMKIGFGVDSFILSKTLHHWINDGLMSVFFFVIGLELKREFMAGELSSPRKAILPIAAAIGGMVFPAAVYMMLNRGLESSSGWGIPMATDIAFALGILALAGKSIPFSVKVFLTALAIVDDLGAVIVIAIFYTSDISLNNLAVGFGFIAVLIAGNRLGIRANFFYAVLGIGGVWLAFMLSGVHATIAGVLAALTIPARTKINEESFAESMEVLNNDFKKADPNQNPLITSKQLDILEKMKQLVLQAETPLQSLEHTLHPIVAFIIMPVFALANAGIEVDNNFFSSLINPVSLGVMGGLLIGKFLGIAVTSKVVVMLGIAELPEDVSWGHIYGVAVLAGIGFTMSLFITGLAFDGPDHAQNAKTGILVSSVVAAVLGLAILKLTPKKKVIQP